MCSSEQIMLQFSTNLEHDLCPDKFRTTAGNQEQSKDSFVIYHINMFQKLLSHHNMDAKLKRPKKNVVILLLPNK